MQYKISVINGKPEWPMPPDKSVKQVRSIRYPHQVFTRVPQEGRTDRWRGAGTTWEKFRYLMADWTSGLEDVPEPELPVETTPTPKQRDAADFLYHVREAGLFNPGVDKAAKHIQVACDYLIDNVRTAS